MQVASEMREEQTVVTDRATARLASFVQQREVLRVPFENTLEGLKDLASRDEIEVWSAGILNLADVNAGPAALLAFCQLTVQSAKTIGLPSLVESAYSAAEICRRAGAARCRDVLNSCLGLAPGFTPLSQPASRSWWHAWLRLAREAPQSVTALSQNAAKIAAACGIEGFDSFVGAGLRSSSTPSQRVKFFALADPSAQIILDRLSGALSFSDVRPRLRNFAAALWGTLPVMRSASLDAAGQSLRRSSIAGGIISIPEVYSGVPASQREILFTAAVGHAMSHLTLGRLRFPIGSLKPLQIVLVGLIEDARVETLAIRRFPGLRRLWAPFHVATPSELSTAPALLARMSRALFDASYEDGHGFIAKARALFGGLDDLENPEHSRRIGSLLGNDLGQMRLQFNPKTYVSEPVYRDDGLGLWTFPSNVSQPDDDGILIEAALTGAGPATAPVDAPHENEPEGSGRAQARFGDNGIAIATYPEWDRIAKTDRPNWATVCEISPPVGDAGKVNIAIEREQGLYRKIERLMLGAKVGRLGRLRRQPLGPDFDLDPLIDAAISFRIGLLPNDRIFRGRATQRDRLALSLLIDISASTSERVPAAGMTIAEAEKLAVAMLASAMEATGDAFALYAFASDGRHHVRFVRIKDFRECFGHEAKGRLEGLQPGLSTRLGAALRHAGAELSVLKASRRIMLALTDGSPSDIDVADPLDLIEDARRAVLAMRGRGIDVFGILLDPAGTGTAGSTIFGRANSFAVHRIEELPARLSEIYFRLTRR